MRPAVACSGGQIAAGLLLIILSGTFDAFLGVREPLSCSGKACLSEV